MKTTARTPSTAKGTVPPACCTLSIDGDEQARFVAMLKAAGNPVRFAILKFLVTHPGCITGDIVGHLPLAQSTVSQHLKVLKDAGLIRGEVDGPRVGYCVEPRALRRLRALVGGL